MDSRAIKVFLLWAIVLLCACKTEGPKEADMLPKALSGKSEILFLEKFKGQSARNSGYFSNHIMNRRLSNLLKPDLEEALSWTKDSSAVVEVTDGKTFVLAKDSSGRLIGFVHSWSAEDAVAFGWIGKNGWNVRKEYSSLPIPHTVPLPNRFETK